MSVVRNELETIKTSTMIVKKSSLEQISYDDLVVFFLDNNNTLKVSVPAFHGLIERTIAGVSSQMDAMKQSQFRSSFENITTGFLWDQFTDDMFVVVCDFYTREVLRMTQLTNFQADCMDYLQTHLDPVNRSYEEPQKRYGRR